MSSEEEKEEVPWSEDGSSFNDFSSDYFSKNLDSNISFDGTSQGQFSIEEPSSKKRSKTEESK